MDVFEVIRTTRAMRRLDPDRAVADADLWTMLEAATKGPSGGNRQQQRWIVVRDPALKAALGVLYREVWDRYQADLSDDRRADPAVRANMASAAHLAEHFGEAPVILVACARRRGDVEAAVYPGVQNLLLAARALGLGATLTTMHKATSVEVRRLLGIPDDVEIFAVIPVGHPLGRFGEARRRPVDEFVHWDRWGAHRQRGAESSLGESVTSGQ
ncbi:MAG TPA: nitroreductase family protein [Acidimicrobiia bacterium]|nr:nitroreductase family protein [Acidimicrobiia bacterium]